MKNLNLKRLLFIFSIFIIFNIPAFARSGFEFALNISIGRNYAYPLKNMKVAADYMEYEMSGSFGFDIGVVSQLGYMFQIKDGFAVSVLGEIGYARDNYELQYNSYNARAMGNSIGNFIINHDSLQIGLLPKFNMKGFSIGIGGGIKIPMSFILYEYGTSSNYPDVNMISGGSGGNVSQGFYSKYKPKVNRDYKIIYYTKITFDYSIFFTENFAFNIGVYFGYDFFPKYQILAFQYFLDDLNEYYNISEKDYYVEKLKNYGTFDFGLQLGLRFGPRA